MNKAYWEERASHIHVGLSFIDKEEDAWREYDRRRICYHEAAHAVVGEAVLPGSSLALYVFPPAYVTEAFGRTTTQLAGLYRWDDTNLYRWGNRNLGAMVLAGKWAEERLGVLDPLHIAGDMEQFREYIWPWDRGVAAAKSKRIVTARWEAIEILAETLYERALRSVPGDWIRTVIGAAA